MIRKKEIEKLPAVPVKADRKSGWTGRIQMAGDAIVMDVYENVYQVHGKVKEKHAEPRFRWVCDKKNFYTYLFQGGTWTGQGIDWAMDAGWYRSEEIRVDKKSQEIAEKFLEGETEYTYYKDAANRLRRLEERIREEKRDRKEQLREQRIEKRQQAKKPLPGGWNRWLKNYVFREERYLFYDSKKRTAGTCAYCGGEVKLSGKQKYNEYGKCPACGSRIQYKAEKKAGAVCSEKQAVYLQKTEEGFLTRYITVRKRSTREGEKYESFEQILATWNGKRIWYDYCTISEFTGEKYWDDRRPSGLSRWNGEGYLYTRNVKQVLKGTVFQYAPLREWAVHSGKEIPFLDFMERYEESPFLEFFIKAGLYRLTEEYVRGYEKWEGKSLKEILGIDRQQLRRLAAMDGGKKALGWLKYEKESGTSIRDELIAWMEKEWIRTGDCEEILKVTGSVVKMTNYIKKQNMPANEAVIMWRDYLRMAERRGNNVMDDIVRFPKKLRQRHDELARMEEEERELEREQKRTKVRNMLNERIKERLPETARYYWENEKYRIIPAGACEELVKEGRTLHHCVGKDDYYMEKMAEGKSWICFLRKKENPDKPWYTIEVDMESDQIMQYYSEFDRKPELDIVEKILDAFRKNIKRKRQETRIRVKETAIA